MPTQIRDKHWTVLELLNWTTGYFRENGVTNPRLNAELLLGKALGLERIMLYARFDAEVSEERRREFRQLVRRRGAGEPLQYVLGEWEFFGRKFAVDRNVLVPRQETELLVRACLERIPGTGSGLWAADICTGSGVIAISIALERPGLRVVGTDTSGDALRVARRNAEAHSVSSRVQFLQGDLVSPVRDALPAGRETVDFMVSNPPYVPEAELDGLDREVRDHEPRQALSGGPDGLTVVGDLVRQAPAVLGPGGWLALEIGPEQAGPVREELCSTGAFETDTIETVDDAGGVARVVCVRRAGR